MKMTEPDTDTSAAYLRWTRGVVVAPNSGVRLRLFCFPFAGGGASAYRQWSAYFTPEIEVCPIQPPGREGRWGEPAFTDLFDLVENLAEVFGPLTGQPFAFFGHSMGGLIAFELTRELRRRGGRLPSWLMVSGARAPHLRSLSPPLHRLPDQAFVREVTKFNDLPEQILSSPEYLELLLPALRCDLTLVETYRYRKEAPLPCPISAFAGRDDRRAPCPVVAAWRAQTAASFTCRVIAGDHFFLFSAQDEMLAAVAADLRAAMREPQRRNAELTSSGSPP